MTTTPAPAVTITLTLPADYEKNGTVFEFCEALRSAISDRVELMRGGDSADEAHHGPDWADQEFKRCMVLLDLMPYPIPFSGG